MIQPETITEKLLFATVRIETVKGSIGTGFFFNFIINDKTYPIIITNKHVIGENQEEEVIFSFHTSTGDKVLDNNSTIKYKLDWFPHQSQDLCFCFAGPFINYFKEKDNIDVFRTALQSDLIWQDVKLQELSAIEEVIMVGYPIGLWDKQNNFPIFRKGITASHPAVDFNNKNIGVVDMACFPGSSGSPIFILNENGFTDRKGVTHIGAKRLIFLGVLSSGPKFTSTGEITVEDIPTQQKTLSKTPVMINLGYYIKAEEILTFEEKIKEIIK